MSHHSPGPGGMKQGQEPRVICGTVSPHGPEPNAFHVSMLGTSIHIPLSIVLASEVQKGQVACLSDRKISRSRSGICPCDLLQCP